MLVSRSHKNSFKSFKWHKAKTGFGTELPKCEKDWS